MSVSSDEVNKSIPNFDAIMLSENLIGWQPKHSIQAMTDHLGGVSFVESCNSLLLVNSLYHQTEN